jgi:formiminotetrahydrofolate cyclodeaminase
MGWLGLGELCEGFEAPLPSPAGGSAAAASAAIAASLVVMVGRGSADWAGGSDAAVSAVGLRERLLALGAEDIEAVEAVLSTGRGRIGSAEGGSGLVEALLWASRIPVEIAECAADVSLLAGAAMREGKRPMRADAEAALLLARAAVQVAVTIVAANLTAPSLPASEVERIGEAARLAAERAGIGPEVRHVLGMAEAR